MKQRLKRLAARHLRAYAERLDPPPKATMTWWPQPDTATAMSTNVSITQWTQPFDARAAGRRGVRKHMDALRRLAR